MNAMCLNRNHASDCISPLLFPLFQHGGFFCKLPGQIFSRDSRYKKLTEKMYTAVQMVEERAIGKASALHLENVIGHMSRRQFKNGCIFSSSSYVQT